MFVKFGNEMIRMEYSVSFSSNRSFASFTVIGKTTRSFIDHAKSPHSSRANSTASPAAVSATIPS